MCTWVFPFSAITCFPIFLVLVLVLIDKMNAVPLACSLRRLLSSWFGAEQLLQQKTLTVEYIYLKKKKIYLNPCFLFYLLSEVRWTRCKCDPAGDEPGFAFINHFCFHLHLGSCFYANEAWILACVIVRLHSPLKLSKTLIRLLRSRPTCWRLTAQTDGKGMKASDGAIEIVAFCIKHQMRLWCWCEALRTAEPLFPWGWSGIRRGLSRTPFSIN